MPTTKHEWKCPKCGGTCWSRTKPPKPGVFVYRGYICKKDKVPMRGTGKTMKHYSLKELL